MKNRLHYAKDFMRDLENIFDYIGTELGNPNAARHMVQRVKKAVQRLEQFSEIGAPLNSIIAIDSDYRFLVVAQYMVFYRVLGQDVYIERILYGRRNYLRVLFGDITDEMELP